MNQNFRDILNRNNFVVLDTETTGLERPAEICEVAIIGVNGEPLVNTLVKTVRPIPAAASTITGITDDMVASAPSWVDVRPMVLDAIRGKDVIVYNATYDRKLMHWSDEAHGDTHIDYKAEATWHCAMEAYAEYYGEINPYYGSYRWQKLSVALIQQGLKLNTAHRALDDCLMTLRLVKHIVGKLTGKLAF